MARGFHFRHGTVDDAAQLARSLRRADRDELLAAHGSAADFTEILTVAVKSSKYCEAWESDEGKLLGLYGVVGIAWTQDAAIPWLLATDDSLQFAPAFLRDGRAKLDAMRSVAPFLVNYVDARNTVSIRFLKRLGFHINAASPFGPLGMPFHQFQIGTPPVYLQNGLLGNIPAQYDAK